MRTGPHYVFRGEIQNSAGPNLKKGLFCLISNYKRLHNFGDLEAKACNFGEATRIFPSKYRPCSLDVFTKNEFPFYELFDKLEYFCKAIHL